MRALRAEISLGTAGVKSGVSETKTLMASLTASMKQVGLGFATALNKSIRFGALSKRLNDWGMRLITGSFFAIRCGHMLQLIKVISPSVWHGPWVVQIGLVEFFHVGRIAPKQV